MKLYMAPGACTTGIHILLEELELAFEAWIVNIPAGDNLKPDYLALNPKGSIPTLVLDDGQALTDYVAISCWLALRYPRARLLPQDPLAVARIIEILSYVTATVHGQGFARIFTDHFTDTGASADAVREKGRELVSRSFAILDGQIAEPYAACEFSIADPALFYVEFWADKLGIPLPARLARHYALMRTRPVVQRVLREEGYR